MLLSIILMLMKEHAKGIMSAYHIRPISEPPLSVTRLCIAIFLLLWFVQRTIAVRYLHSLLVHTLHLPHPLATSTLSRTLEHWDELKTHAR